MGIALEWEPWNWDLWLEPDDDDVGQEVWMRKLEELLQKEADDLDGLTGD